MKTEANRTAEAARADAASAEARWGLVVAEAHAGREEAVQRVDVALQAQHAAEEAAGAARASAEEAEATIAQLKAQVDALQAFKDGRGGLDADGILAALNERVAWLRETLGKAPLPPEADDYGARPPAELDRIITYNF